jgi:hypothetical protein
VLKKLSKMMSQMLGTPLSYVSIGRRSRSGTRRHQPARVRPAVEVLEDRTTPAILFAPQHGALNATSDGGAVLGGSSDVHIYNIFWGSYWRTSAGQNYANLIESSIDPIFHSSRYLDNLFQYGIGHRASVDPRPGTMHFAFNYSEPQSGFSTLDTYNAALNAVQQGLPVDSNAIYFVITPPGTTSGEVVVKDDGTVVPVAAYHTYSTVHSVPFTIGWIGTDSTVDYVTRLLSHEVVEAMTDPNLDAWHVSPANPPENEIADNEAEAYSYRVNGYLVQAYWSQNDTAFRVDDGTSQFFYVNKDPNVFEDGKGQLVINGDQFGDAYNDSIIVDVNPAGGVWVNLNGEVVSFEPGQITSIVVNTGAGTNYVNVNNEALAVGLTINDGGDDHVYLGSQGSVQGIKGSVQINSPSNHTQLVINDSADTVAQKVVVDDLSVIGLAPGNIGFNSDGLSYLTIYGGSGGNTFYVFNTPSTYNGVTPGFTWIDSGAGIDTVDVVGTAGGPHAGGLYINGESGHDYVYVGTDTSTASPRPGNGTLAGINGFVYAFNPGGVTSLYVDDAADATGRVVTLNSNSLTGLSAGTIYWVPTSSYTGGVDDLHIYGSGAASTYNVTDTPSLYYYTDLITGTGNDTVIITGTTGYVGTYNTGGYDSVYVGTGTLAGINGAVNVSGAGSTYLYVQDYNDTIAHTATLTGNSLMGLSTGTIWWAASSTAMGGVTYLSIADSAGSSTWNVTDTPNLYYFTNLYTGAGNDTVYISGTTGTLNVNNLDGYDSVSVGSNGTLANVNGTVNVSGNGSTYLYIEDYNDTTSHTATLTATSLTGLSRGAIQWVPTVSATGGVTFLDITGSAAGSIYNITDTPALWYYTDFNTGAGNDTVNITGTTGAVYLYNGGGSDNVYVGNGTLAGINGFVYAYGAGSTYLYVQDGSDTTARSATLNGYSLTGLSTGTIQWAPSVTYLRIDGSAATSTYNVTDTPNLRFSTDLITGAGNDTVTVSGSTGVVNVYNRGGYDSVYVGTGTLAGINGAVNVSGAGPTYLYVQDYSDTTARTATLAGTYLMGLSSGLIGWTPSSTAMGGVTYLKITGSSAGSTYNVSDTPILLYSTDLVTGAGNDTINISGTTGVLNLGNMGGFDTVNVGSNGTLAGINGSLNVSGAGSTYLYVQDYNDTTAHTATLTATSLTGLSKGSIQWVPSVTGTGGVTFLDITGSAAGSTYNVSDTPNLYYYTELNTGAGSDTVFITGTTGPMFLFNGGGADTVVIGRQASATTGKVAAVKGWLDIGGAGTTALTVDDSGDSIGRSATLTASSLAGLAPATIFYETSVTSLTINGGNGNDTLTVASTSPSTPVTFNSGNGTDTLVGPNTPNTWTITGTDVGNLNGAVFFTRVATLVGGTDVDTFAFATGGRMVSLDGGGAPAGTGDWLDYTAYPGAVSVNLATGKATGVTATVSNIQNVFGGNHGNTLTGNAQGNILIGGSGADTIIGGSGRSLLIGGKGSDTIIAGSDDDIVIGGYTSYDQAHNEAALMDVLARWQSADSYAARISNLRAGYRPLVLGTTVFDDGGADRLTGNAGMDWFFAGARTAITDPQAGEVVN